MSKDKFLRGAMILTMAGLMVKVIGSVNRILLSRLLGGEGIGLYQMAYPVYLLLLAVASAGVPVSISIIVAEYLAKGDRAGVRRVFSVSLRMMAVVGLVLAASLFAAAGWMVDSGIIRDGRAYYALVALTPAVFFASILASFRGFFQGHQLMTPPAMSQIIEQFVRVVTMVALAYALLPRGLEYAAAGAAFGAVPGSVTGLIVLSFFYRRYRRMWQYDSVPESDISSMALVKRLALLALPVSCANILVPVTSSIDMLLVPKCLIESGFSVEEATTLFGYLAGMAQPLIMMATIPTVSLTASLVPAVSEAFTLGRGGEIERKAATAMKLCCLITVPAAVGMSALAGEISGLLYGTVKAAPAIMHSGPAICFLGMQQVTTGVLQGMGKINLPMLHIVIGLVCKTIAVLLLTDAAFNIAGAAWATNINFGVAALLNILVLRYYKISFHWYNIFKILLAALIMGGAAIEGHRLLSSCCGPSAAAAGAICLAAGVYALLLPVLGVVSKDELRQMPLLKKFLR